MYSYNFQKFGHSLLARESKNKTDCHLSLVRKHEKFGDHLV